MTATQTDDWSDLLGGEDITTIDRTPLERAATCPWQCYAVESGIVSDVSPEADSGQAVHDVLSRLLQRFVAGDCDLGDLKASAEQELYESRPDIQPDAIKGLIRSLYDLCAFVLYHQWSREPRHPSDIIAFDGGRGEQSGQKAWDMPTDNTKVRLTCELDLLMAAGSDEELDLWDWKSGNKLWSPTAIGESFQLGCFYPCMVFINYPKCQMIRVRVWNTRPNQLTGAVQFTRKRHLNAWIVGIASAVEVYLKHHEDPKAPTWPGLEKCAICPAAHCCPDAAPPAGDFVQDPGVWLHRMVQLQAGVDQIKKTAAAYVKKHGEIVLPDIAFGREWPKKTTAATNKLYKPNVLTENNA